MKPYLTLKFGTLKRWNFDAIPAAQLLFKQYLELGAAASASSQSDTPEQKEIICKLIDLMPGDIYLDWHDKYITKEEAKKYVLDYNTAPD